MGAGASTGGNALARAKARKGSRSRDRSPARASDRKIARLRRLVDVEALRVVAARARLDEREADLADAVQAALDGGATPEQVRAWLAEAGVTEPPPGVAGLL
ncbi:hypothetical protein TR74_09950 [Carbonactinospora thermoautotrophica]|uniref:Uncharacterized protein n=1 Tax=Carbonactinospora thermoautotrophica TaxID=1469144 RepID=A0A132NH26_9ACTN|nr:hypothetical protein [Carbonactinospora thermoautotrophica]KWX09379.1 hypothetical protein TR74_09950 [Carbonactinospora thermoautotrophica]